MATCLRHDWQDAGEVGDSVAVGNERRGHKADTEDDDPGNDPNVPESLPHRRPLLEEMRELDLFDGRRPLHVVSGQMGKSDISACLTRSVLRLTVR